MLTTTFSPDRIYRYTLVRAWPMLFGDNGYAMFICLNPSTADENFDDPTVRRCIIFAKTWGYSGMVMTNLFAYRSTDPKVLRTLADPVGPENDRWLRECAEHAGIVIAGWGSDKAIGRRAGEVMNLVGDVARLHCLSRNDDGSPEHPLYLRKDLRPMLL